MMMIATTTISKMQLTFLLLMVLTMILSSHLTVSSPSPSFKIVSIINNYPELHIDHDYIHVNKIQSSHNCRSSSISLSHSKTQQLMDMIPRGGSLTTNRNDEDTDQSLSSIIIDKVRNLYRSVFQISERKVPPLAILLKFCSNIVQTLSGIDLLESINDNDDDDDDGISTKLKQKKKKKSKQKDNQQSDDSNKTKTKTSNNKSKSPTSKPSSTPKKSSSSSSSNKSAQTHLNQKIKITNPNYRIQRELKEFLSSPPPNLSVQVGKNIRVWIITLTGAKNTIYEGEKYKLRVFFPPEYPTVPPSVYFLQPTPRHEHVYTNGDICLSLLGKDWRPTMTAQSIAVSILSILSGAQKKMLPMDNVRHAQNKPGGRQDDWVYHDDNC